MLISRLQVAGLAAYFLSEVQITGQVAVNMRTRLTDTAARPIVPRSRPSVIWNFQDGSRDPNLGSKPASPLNHSLGNSSRPLVSDE